MPKSWHIFCYTMLGLRYPNEPTYATWTSLLASFDPECSSFDLRSKYETVKNVWQNAKTRLARTHVTPALMLPKLPLSFDELTADMQAAYGEARPLAQWPRIDPRGGKAILASSHAELACELTGREEGCGPQAGGCNNQEDRWGRASSIG